MKKELRRNQTLLVTLGSGIILFGAWSVLKTLLYSGSGLYAEVLDDIEPEYAIFAKIFAFVFVALVLLADFSLRLFIGRAARAEGMGRRQKNTYLWLAAILLFLNLSGDVYSVYMLILGISSNSRSFLDFIVSLFVDLTSLLLLGVLLVTVRRVRRLRAMLEG